MHLTLNYYICTMGLDYSHPGHQKLKFLTFVYLRISVSVVLFVFIITISILFYFSVLKSSFKILKILSLTSASSFCIWCNRYVRKAPIIKSFCAWTGDIISAKTNSVLFNWKCMLNAQVFQFTASYLALKTIKQHWLSSTLQSTVFLFESGIWKNSPWFGIINTHNPCTYLIKKDGHS